MTLIFLLKYCPDSEECFSYPDHVFEMISHYSAVIWSKSFRQKVWKSDFLTNQKIVSWAFFRPSFQQFRPFPAIFSFLRVVWPWLFLWFGESIGAHYCRRVWVRVCARGICGPAQDNLNFENSLKNAKTTVLCKEPFFLSYNFTFPLIFSFIRVVRL